MIIELDVGEIQVKLVEGEEEVQEWQIVLGAQVTRLRDGKYEIVRDAPSDRLSVSNRQFTIRNGETVVARITPRNDQPAADKEVEIIQPGTTLAIYIPYVLQIRRQYLDSGYLKKDSQNKVTVSVIILLKPGERLEVRTVTGP